MATPMVAEWVRGGGYQTLISLYQNRKKGEHIFPKFTHTLNPTYKNTHVNTFTNMITCSFPRIWMV